MAEKSQRAVKALITGGFIMELKKQIDQELSDIVLPEDFANNVLYAARNRRKRKLQTAILILCVILTGGTASAGYFLYNNIHVNKEILPALESMEKKIVNNCSGPADDMGHYLEEYNSYQELCSALGIDLLSSELAENNPYMLIRRETDNLNWNIIYVNPYILGDVKSVNREFGKNRYTWEEGSEFSSPIDMEINIIVSESQLKHGWEKDFLGTYEFVETYTTVQGYQADIIKDISVTGAGRPKYCAVLVADGIRYILNGQVTIEKMKEIIDSLK